MRRDGFRNSTARVVDPLSSGAPIIRGRAGSLQRGGEWGYDFVSLLIWSMMGLLSSFESIVGGGEVCVDRHVVSMLCIV